MTSIIEILPVELIDHMIDIVADDDHIQSPCKWPNIKACSLTCRALAALCRRHIFRCVTFSDFERSPEQVSLARRTSLFNFPLARSFAKLITNKPEIADHVREVYFIVQNIDDGTPLSSYVALYRLNKLETISIHTCLATTGGYPWCWRWQDLHPISRTVILKLLYRPSITSVVLSSMDDFIMSDLVPCTHLQCLTLKDVVIDENVVSPPNTSIQLRELTLADCLQTKYATKLLILNYEDGTPVVDPGNLRKFKSCITINNQESIAFVTEVIKLAKNVEDVYLFVVLGQDEPPETMINLLSPSLRTLRRLSLACSIDADSDHYYNINNVFRRLSTTNCIESLQLRIQIESFGGRILSPDIPSLRECLLELGWPFLKRVDLSVFKWHREAPEYQPTLEDSSVTFHRLSTNALLEFKLNKYIGRLDPLC